MEEIPFITLDLKIDLPQIFNLLDDIRRLSADLPCFFKSHIHNHDTLSGFFVKTKTLTNDMSKRNKTSYYVSNRWSNSKATSCPGHRHPGKCGQQRPPTMENHPGFEPRRVQQIPKVVSRRCFSFFRWCFGIKFRRGSKKKQLDWWSWVMILIHGQLVQLGSFMVFRWYYLEAKDKYSKWP